MPRKRVSSRHSSSASPATLPRWRQILLVLTIVPMLAGILLFAGAWAGVVVLGTSTEQTVTGALLTLLGFAASNALQNKWRLAGGWAALGAAIALLLSGWGLWPGVAGALFGVAGLVLLATEFVRRL